MIVFRRCGTFGRMTVSCTNSQSVNNIVPSVSKLSKDYVICCITKTCISKSNIKSIRNMSDNSSVNSFNDFQTKVMILNRGINNDNVNMTMLTSIIEDLENSDYDMPQTLSLMLLRCCGNVLYNEPLKKRQELVDRVWNLLKRKLSKLTINHYHILLQAYIDNDQVIDPNAFLKNMTVTPDYNIYCLLLKVQSTDNCTFADALMLKIEQNTFSIGRKILNALMYTYAMNGNTAGVMKVSKLMEEDNIAPSHVNNIYLMYAYAKGGKIEALTESLKNTVLPWLHTTRLIKYLSLSGHGSYIPNILKYVEPVTTEREVIPVIIQLVHTGHALDACKVVSHIPHDSKLQNIIKSLVFCLLKEMIKLNENPESVLNVINNLAEKNSVVNIWKQAIEVASQENKALLAFKMFDAMKATGASIESCYFWPLFVNAKKHNSETDIYAVLRHMTAIDVTVDSKTLISYVFPFIDISNPVAAVIKMKEYGVTPSYTVEPLIKFLVDEGRLQESITLCTSLKKKIDCQKILDSLFISYMKSNDINSCIYLLYQLCYNGHGFSGTFIKKLIEVAQFSENNKEDVIKFLIATKHHKAVIAPADSQYLEEKILDLNFDEDQKKFVLQLIFNINTENSKQNYNAGPYIHPQYMNTDQLHEHLHELKDKKKNPKGVLRKLLIKCCNMNDAESVQKLLSEIQGNKHGWSPGMRLSLFYFYVKTKMIEEATSELHKIQSQFPNCSIDNFKILRYVTLLLENNKLTEAFDVLEKCMSVNHRPDAHVQIHEILDTLIKNNYSDYIERMINLLAERGYCSDKHQLFRYLILAQMLKGKIPAAVTIFSTCVEQYNKTPAKQEIMIELMKLLSTSCSEYKNLLKTVYELIINVHGRSVADVNLVVAFAVCNKIPELQSFLQTTKVKEQLLLRQLHFLKDEDILTAALSMLDTVCDRTRTHLEPICNLTLSIYDKQGDCNGAIELKKKMDLKGIKPSATFEKTFNTLLKIHKFSRLPSNLTKEVESNVNRCERV